MQHAAVGVNQQGRNRNVTIQRLQATEITLAFMITDRGCVAKDT